jgi:ribosomal protein L37E
MIVHFLKYGVTACMMPGVPCDWPEHHRWVSDENKDKVTCQACLEGMKYGDPSFELLEEGKAIKCRRCGKISHNPGDVLNHYCAHCHVSHDDIWPPARKAWVEGI